MCALHTYVNRTQRSGAESEHTRCPVQCTLATADSNTKTRASLEQAERLVRHVVLPGQDLAEHEHLCVWHGRLWDPWASLQRALHKHHRAPVLHMCGDTQHGGGGGQNASGSSQHTARLSSCAQVVWADPGLLSTLSVPARTKCVCLR